ncbi:Ergosterol biosynthetic protein 28 [Leucoagaricus sp. SymC.cos]|nr:Ergosterol biosynthetic protein 28 [Leucoagaricus sp. SymC.cos]
MSAMLDNFVAYLPSSLLGKWQLIVASAAVFNTIQNFTTLKLTRRIYDNVPSASVTALQARTFAVWTLTSAVVRFYAAYHIHEKVIYDMALFTYLIAFGHFSTELFIFRTARINVGVLSPVIVSTTSLIWMLNQYDFYVRS